MVEFSIFILYPITHRPLGIEHGFDRETGLFCCELRTSSIVTRPLDIGEHCCQTHRRRKMSQRFQSQAQFLVARRFDEHPEIFVMEKKLVKESAGLGSIRKHERNK